MSAVAVRSAPVACPAEDLYAAALGGTAIDLVDEGGRAQTLPVDRWRTLDGSDRGLLRACVGATLDVGCGPGRLTHALARGGQYALGLDVSGAAVRMTRARGARAVCRDVYGAVPRPGRWETVLLADGNIGIGGDPVRLLARSHRLLRVDGRVVVDLAPPGVPAATRSYRLTDGRRLSHPFAWSVVPLDGLHDLVARAGFVVGHTAQDGGRHRAVLLKALPDAA